MHREDVEHELRTPLTTIKGVLRLLAVGRLAEFSPKDANELLDRAWQQLIKLEKVVAAVEAQFVSRDDDETATVVYEETAGANATSGPQPALVIDGSAA